MNTLEHHLRESLNEYLAFARNRLRDPDLAVEVVQESVLKALRAQAQIQDGRN